MIQRFSQLLSQKPQCDFDDMRLLLSNVNELENQVGKLTKLLEETLVALMAKRDETEVSQLFAEVNAELDQARVVLAEIRGILRKDGPDEAKRARAKMGQNPIDMARVLLDQVAEKFKQKPDKGQVDNLQKMHAELEQLIASEKSASVARGVGCV